MTVLAASVLQLEEILTEIQAERAALQRLVLTHTEILKAFSDLYLELCGKNEERRFLDKSIHRAEREAARLRLPLWFWKVDREQGIHHQIWARAKFLVKRKTSIDDTFDLLREFVDEYTRPEKAISDEQIGNIIGRVFRKMESLGNNFVKT